MKRVSSEGGRLVRLFMRAEGPYSQRPPHPANLSVGPPLPPGERRLLYSANLLPRCLPVVPPPLHSSALLHSAKWSRMLAKEWKQQRGSQEEGKYFYFLGTMLAEWRYPWRDLFVRSAYWPLPRQERPARH